MAYKQINISSGHSINCQGASGYVNEVTEARKVVDRVYEMCKAVGIEVYKYHDTASSSSQNLANIVNFHNRFKDGIDVSIHFNAYQTTSNPMGVEVCYYSQSSVASSVSSAIAQASGLKNRGAKERKGLYFLKHTSKPSILIEVCFCDSKADVDLYHKNFDAICAAIVKALTGAVYNAPKPQPAPAPAKPTTKVMYRVVAGSYASRENAEAQVKKLKDAGFDSFITTK